MGEVSLKKMIPLYGNWVVSDTHDNVCFRGGDSQSGSHGLALLNTPVSDGIIECDISIDEPNNSSGAFVIFRANGQHEYFAAGLGGWDAAYSLFEGRNLTPNRLQYAGSINNLLDKRIYKIQIILDGQRVQLLVDGIKVIDYDRLPSATGNGLGLFSFRGTNEARFGPIKTSCKRPTAFVAMPFKQNLDDVYYDAIKPLIDDIGYEPIRADEVSAPGIILNDIWQYITESSVVIAEVSEQNPNVFYEIGVAHALQKPTILLAERATKLPFDIGPHRCIFYDNTIAGRRKLLDALRGSLASSLGLASRDSVKAGP